MGKVKISKVKKLIQYISKNTGGNYNKETTGTHIAVKVGTANISFIPTKSLREGKIIYGLMYSIPREPNVCLGKVSDEIENIKIKDVLQSKPNYFYDIVNDLKSSGRDPKNDDGHFLGLIQMIYINETLKKIKDNTITSLEKVKKVFFSDKSILPVSALVQKDSKNPSAVRFKDSSGNYLPNVLEKVCQFAIDPLVYLNAGPTISTYIKDDSKKLGETLDYINTLSNEELKKLPDEFVENISSFMYEYIFYIFGKYFTDVSENPSFSQYKFGMNTFANNFNGKELFSAIPNLQIEITDIFKDSAKNKGLIRKSGSESKEYFSEKFRINKENIINYFKEKLKAKIKENYFDETLKNSTFLLSKENIKYEDLIAQIRSGANKTVQQLQGGEGDQPQYFESSKFSNLISDSGSEKEENVHLLDSQGRPIVDISDETVSSYYTFRNNYCAISNESKGYVEIELRISPLDSGGTDDKFGAFPGVNDDERTIATSDVKELMGYDKGDNPTTEEILARIQTLEHVLVLAGMDPGSSQYKEIFDIPNAPQPYMSWEGEIHEKRKVINAVKAHIGSKVKNEGIPSLEFISNFLHEMSILALRLINPFTIPTYDQIEKQLNKLIGIVKKAKEAKGKELNKESFSKKLKLTKEMLREITTVEEFSGEFDRLDLNLDLKIQQLIDMLGEVLELIRDMSNEELEFFNNSLSNNSLIGESKDKSYESILRMLLYKSTK